MSTEQLTAHLADVSAKLEQTRHNLTGAAICLDDAAQRAGAAVQGTTNAEAARIPAWFAQASQELATSLATISAVEKVLTRYLASINGVRGTSTPKPHVTPPNRHGDRYPEEALPYSDDLPPRVRRGERNSPMTGHVLLDGRDVGTISATRADVWTDEVAARIDSLGMPDDMFALTNHVEMKTVAMMIRNGARYARVIINHAPCGSGPGLMIGCDQFLSDFIPKGYSLTVLGTDQNGNPFKRTYHGRVGR
ncbi:MAG: hypothetical protein M3548_00055 [Actinomycetota bacterium]|nr:hypothetical protein [Actinomycetota bacterium]